ncbi:SPOR domain-containing protein [Glutamicibacter sp.]|uniref:SPOR domain-containing protein n=1 Tax=Glutamicibacter sp. TaxID=1931995 RepID=UPI0028BE0DF9|nr:SPOR domain-containing protein [Glutamicibacter sp.]
MSSVGTPGEGQYWYNVTTKTIERGPQSDWSRLLGPYDSEEEARNAMAKVQARNEAWDEQEEDEE